MSGDEKEMTADAKSIDSALIWADNPELEYFRSMMANRLENKLASGLEMEDSLIGDSTVREMMEVGDNYDTDSRNSGSILRRLGVRDTSGLSDAESNTVDNIYIEDESILAMENAISRVVDDGTIESMEDKDLVPHITGTHLGRNLYQSDCPDLEFNNPIQLEYQQSKPLKNPPLQHEPHFISSPQLKVPHPDGHDGIEKLQESTNIPGIIFVTDGHPSIIHTCPNTKSCGTNRCNDESKHGKYKSRCLPRSLIFCLSLVVIIAVTVIGVLIYLIKSESSVFTSPRQNDGLPFLSPNDPFLSPTETPTLETSSLREDNRPQVISGTPSSPPVIDDVLTTSPESDSILDTETPKGSTPISTVLPSSFRPSPEVDFIPITRLSLRPSPIPTKLRTPLVESFPNDVQSSIPTMRPTVLSLNSPTPTSKSKDFAEPSPTELTDLPTIRTTSSTSEVSTSAVTSLTCLSTVATDKTCYQNGENIRISFNNCVPTSSDWIGIYPARLGISNLRQPSLWLWTCGDQLCNNPVANGEATLFDASGYGTFRALLLRDNQNRGNGYSAYAIGNRFTIASICN